MDWVLSRPLPRVWHGVAGGVGDTWTLAFFSGAASLVFAFLTIRDSGWGKWLLLPVALLALAVYMKLDEIGDLLL